MNRDAMNDNTPSKAGTNSRPDQTPAGLDRDTDHTATRPRQSPSQHRMAGWLGSSAADLLGPGLVLATQDQGYTAALNGDHLDTCPWRAADTDRDRALRQMWIRGYAAGRTDLRIARDGDCHAP